MRALKLMADYGCWPLWEASPGNVGNVAPVDLPISDRLKERLAHWAAEYDATLDQNDPAQSGFESPMAEASFVARGLTLRDDLQAELGQCVTVTAQIP